MTKADATSHLARCGISPRGLPVEAAAAYVGLSAPTFLAEVEAGSMPKPLPLRRSERKVWDREALDRALDRLAGVVGATDDPVMHAILSKGRPT